MRKASLIGLLALTALLSCNKGGDDPRLVIITYDGLRWQEVYSGADEALIDKLGQDRKIQETKDAYWRETPEERREALLPFIWSYVPQHGYMLGNRNKDSRMQVANAMSFSYPGYSEMFCGWADDERINYNDPIENPNHNVLEAVNQDPRYKGKVMMYASWESIRYAIANERAGIPGSAKYEPGLSDTPVTRILNRVQEGMPRPWDSERYDAFTYAFAMETLKKDHPQVFYVGFGDTDEWGHDAEYDKYLKAAHDTDGFIRDIVEFCESDPYYKGKTTYLLLCDHGRGRGGAYTSHGSGTRGSNETWFMAFGKGVPVLGETEHNGPFYNKQLASTIADILGVDFTPDNGEKPGAFDPAFYEDPKAPESVATFTAVKASPKGQGLRYVYSEGNFMSVKEVAAAPAKARGIAPVFSTDMKLREDHFGLVFKGLLKIDEEGLYCLSLASDDGSKLWLDGELLWDLDRDGGGTREAWLNLGKGYHRLEVQYFENYGGETMEVGLTGPGVDTTNIPANLLYYE